MTNSSKPNPAPLMVRLSAKQRAQLVKMAAGKPLSTYAKSVLFSDDPKTLAQLLAWLGQSQLAAHLAILANAAESGSLDLNEPVTKAVLKACADIEEMRKLLMRALGKQAPASETIPRSKYQPICHSFLTASELSEERR